MPSTRLAEAARSGRRREIILGAALVLATIIFYYPVLGAGFIWDDAQYVTANTTLRSLDGLRRIWIPRETPQYYPLVFTGFWLEHQLWGVRPFGYHLVNVLLHGFSAVLVWRLGRRLALPGAWIIAAVFALHPVHVESVAWVAERKNVLSGVFYLLAALAYLRFDDAREPAAGDAEPPGSRVGRRWYLFALILFVCALLSKTVTASLPAALILMLLLRGRRPDLRMLAPLFPMFALGLLLGLHTAHLERVHVGALGPEFDFTLPERLVIASRALLFYPAKLGFPTELCFNYPRWTIDASALASYWPLLPISIAFVGALVLWRRGRRGPLLALAFYALTIFPALGFFNVYPMIYSFVADHFQYLASLGIIALVVGSAAKYLAGYRLAAPFAGVLLLGLGVLTWYQSTMYQDYDEGRLWEWTLRYNPDSWLAHSTLGIDRCRAGRLEEGRAHLEAALAIKPESPLVHANLGELHFVEGDREKAVASLAHAAGLDELYAGQVAMMLVRVGRASESEPWWRRALVATPEALPPRQWLAQALLTRGEVDEAARLLEEALRIDPGFFPAHLMLGDISRGMGNIDRGLEHYRAALNGAAQEVDQVAALTRLAGLLSTWPGASDTQRQRAVAYGEVARTITAGRDPDTLAVLSGAYAATGRIDEAIAMGTEAARLAREVRQDAMAVEIERMVEGFRRRGTGRP